MRTRSPGRNLFLIANGLFLAVLSVSCVLPFLHIFAVSFSSKTAAAAGAVGLWPREFTVLSYEYILSNQMFVSSFGITLQRVLLGTAINMLLVILIAYPLSKEVKSLRSRTAYVWFFVFTMLFNGGLIPWYLTVKYTGLLDTLWALLLPGAVPVFNVVLLLNFFRGLPKELEEAAFMDGAGQWTTLWRIFVPLSKPAMATIGLFTIVMHWNSWFDGLILMNRPENYPLSSFLQTIVANNNLAKLLAVGGGSLSDISDRTAKAALIFLASLPILAVYPFLQKYFVKGIVLGSVKG